jgi:glycosyltransferase involved in cell wall biosynthesis
MINFSIIITTYQRPDGTTPDVLTRALQSVINQTYQNWKLFLIGDKYEDDGEFKNLLSIINPDQIVYMNLDYAYERDKYLSDKHILWTCGGVHARNVGLQLVKDANYQYCCQLDHDDYWHPEHLEKIANAIDSNPDACVYHTLSYHHDGSILPKKSVNNLIEKIDVGFAKLIHSSACLNLKHITYKYVNVFEETGSPFPADAYMWERINDYCINTGNYCIVINTVTCYHLDEGNTKI